ncbi:MAG: hypothetical protein U9R26_05885 [Campylobacterota bacterium]|nr:hypothetical protein [Campylobacterota bacterium]
MKKLLKFGFILAGSMALMLTAANAKCGDGDKTPPKTMKCESGKCDTGKCGNSTKETKPETNTTKSAPEKGKCGQGKCG